MNEFPKSNLILRLIKEKSKIDGISQKRLCYGICDAAYISRCIKNDIEMDKLMLDALMQRLGISVRSYKYILRDSEYQYFTLREKTRMCIYDNKIDEANTLIEQYFEMIAEMKGSKKLHRQMALLLRSYVLEQENADLTIQMQNIDEAIACSIPQYNILGLSEYLLSEVELLLLTRRAMLFEKMEKEDEASVLYCNLHELQKGKTYASGELTYIFVVVDYHLSKICLQKKDYYSAKRIAEEAIDKLSNNNKFLFVVELLEIVSGLEENEMISKEKTYDYKTIKKFILKYMPSWNPDTYYPLYREFSVYSFRKMIVQRRKMLGLTQEELSIKCCCDIATIERMEQGIVDTQSDIAYHILNTVGLPIEKCFYLLQTSSYEAREKYLKLTVAINENKLEEAKKLLYVLKESIDMSLIINQQIIMFVDSVIQYKVQNSSPEDKIKEFFEILNYTIPIETIGKYEVLLYGNEIEIIRNIAMCYEKTGNADAGIRLLEWVRMGFSKEKSVGEESVASYLSISKLIESMYANRGNFEESNRILDICMPKVVEQDILGFMLQFMYDKMWNKTKQKEHVDNDSLCEIKAAYEIAKLSKDERTISYIKKMINSLSK